MLLRMCPYSPVQVWMMMMMKSLKGLSKLQEAIPLVH